MLTQALGSSYADAAEVRGYDPVVGRPRDDLLAAMADAPPRRTAVV